MSYIFFFFSKNTKVRIIYVCEDPKRKKEV
jgi:hypothetical protein